MLFLCAAFVGIHIAVNTLFEITIIVSEYHFEKIEKKLQLNWK